MFHSDQVYTFVDKIEEWILAWMKSKKKLFSIDTQNITSFFSADCTQSETLSWTKISVKLAACVISEYRIMIYEVTFLKRYLLLII